MNQPNGQQQINIRPEDTTGVTCEKCDAIFFIPVYMIRKVSALLSPSGREEHIQVPLMACANCGQPQIPEGFEDEAGDEDGSTIITK